MVTREALEARKTEIKQVEAQALAQVHACAGALGEIDRLLAFFEEVADGDDRPVDS